MGKTRLQLPWLWHKCFKVSSHSPISFLTFIMSRDQTKSFSGLNKISWYLLQNSYISHFHTYGQILSGSVGGHSVGRGTRVLVNMWSIHHDPHHWDKPDLFNPGKTQPPSEKWLTFIRAPERTTSMFSCLRRSFPWRPGPAGHTILLPAVWGGTSGVRWRIVGQTGAVSLLGLAASADEFQAAGQGGSAKPAGAAGCGFTAITL